MDERVHKEQEKEGKEGISLLYSRAVMYVILMEGRARESKKGVERGGEGFY